MARSNQGELPVLNEAESDTVRALIDAGMLEDVEENGVQSYRAPSTEPLDAISELRDFLDTIPDDEEGARVLVYRVADGKNGTRAGRVYLFEALPVDFLDSNTGVERIKREYGGGVYEIRVLRRMEQTVNGKTFRRQAVAKTKMVMIEESKPGAAPVEHHSDGGASLELGRIMMNEQQATREMIRLAMENTANMVKEIMLARKPEKSTREMLEEMMLIKQFVTPPPVPAVAPTPQRNVVAEVKDMMEMMGMIRETVAEVDPTDSNSAMIGLGKQLLSVVTSGQLGPLTQGGAPAPVAPAPAPQQLQRPQPQPVRRPAAASPESAAPMPQPMQSPSQEQDMNVIIRAAIGQLITLAGNDADPYVYANVVLDQAGDETTRAFLGSADWWTDLVKLHPGVVPHETWFRELQEEVMRLLSETDDDTSPEQEIEPGLETGVSVESNANDGNAPGNT